MADSLTPIDHGVLIQWVTSAEEATQESREVSEKCRHYYDSRQWTDAEARALKKRKQAATVINRIKPKMDGLMGMEKANKTTAKAFPRTPKHEKSAEAATEAIRFVLQDNFYDQKRSAAWDTILLEGSGALEVTVRKKDFKLIINQIPWDRLIYDEHSRRKDFSDARWLGQVVWMDLDQALEDYPDAKDVLEVLPSGTQTYDDKPKWYDSVRKRVKIVEVYYKDRGNVWYSCFTRSGYVKPPAISPFKNEEGETEWPYEFASAFVGLDGDRYGAAYQLLDLQDDLNKRRSKFQHLLSVRQIRLEKGAVDDLNKVRQELAKPDGVIETTPGMEFEVLKTGDMAAAQFNLYQDSKLEIDAVSFNAAASGKDTHDLSGIALQRRQLAGQTELAPLFDVLKHLDIRIYRKVWNRIRQYWKDEKWIRVTDDQQNLRWVGLNKPMTRGEQVLKEAQDKGVPPEALQQLQMQILQDPTMQEEVVLNDVSDLDVDIIIDDSPDVLTTQIEDFQVLGEMVKSGFPMPPEAVIMASPLSHKDRILKLMKETPQIPEAVRSQMEKLQEAAQKLQEENQALKQEQAADQAKLVAESEAMKVESVLKKQRQDAELELAREKAAAEIELKRQIAAADAEIEQQKHAIMCEQKEKEMAFNQEAKEKEMKFNHQVKMAEDPKFAEIEAMPKMAETFEKLAQALVNVDAILAKQLDVQQQTLQTITKPKQVAISGVKRGRDGTIAGATVVTH